ncbi:MAG: hypothetical protein NC299_16130 [Lachnospiraceae bacterium]|nr:hypothetical protein [Ruminococcus sp.]MCM1276864.1 hypothetical protein [Lachnospiraceae bacterium]
MRYNVQSTTAVEKPVIEIPDDCKFEFVKAMKIRYYKEFHKQGLITDEQLEQLIALQSNKAA